MAKRKAPSPRAPRPCQPPPSRVQRLAEIQEQLHRETDRAKRDALHERLREVSLEFEWTALSMNVVETRTPAQAAARQAAQQEMQREAEWSREQKRKLRENLPNGKPTIEGHARTPEAVAAKLEEYRKRYPLNEKRELVARLCDFFGVSKTTIYADLKKSPK